MDNRSAYSTTNLNLNTFFAQQLRSKKGTTPLPDFNGEESASVKNSAGNQQSRIARTESYRSLFVEAIIQWHEHEDWWREYGEKL